VSKTSEAIVKVKTELAQLGIGKDGRNEGQGFRFRSIDQVMDALSAITARNGLVIAPFVMDFRREETTSKTGTVNMTTIVTVRYDMRAQDAEPGDVVSACFIGEGKDSGDKASSKALAMAYKYFSLQTFIIPLSGQQVFADDAPQVDADATDPEPSQPKAAKVSAPKVTVPAGVSFEDLIGLIESAQDDAALNALKTTLTKFTSHPSFKDTIPAAFRAKQAALKESK